MSQTLQNYLVVAIPKAIDDLVAAVKRLPADKVAWSPMGQARTALDQLAEVALLNGATAEMLTAKAWTMGDDFAEYEKAKAALATDLDACLKLLAENSAKVVEVIKGLSDEDLAITIQMPWAAMTLAQTAMYAYWNPIYHEGQINYIASMLGCLD
jgi:uncharacterized damage-inducible protein DinB